MIGSSKGSSSGRIRCQSSSSSTGVSTAAAADAQQQHVQSPVVLRANEAAAEHPSNIKPTETPPPALTGMIRYSSSYQTVSTGFCYALPLQQLSLAFSGLPKLLENFKEELL
jgi:hypothetical protein